MQSSNGKKTSKKKRKPTGAVMVVGGGIAGMQASLDLGDQGFKVYLVETKSAIGGKMAQLDKTFPTNDCSMCTISPKLVETGRHPNIEIMTTTDVLDIKGEAGDFTVKVRHRPRYIDMDKCVACNDCVEVCPVSTPGEFDEGLAPRKAIYKMYPQATPNAYAIEKKGIAPCQNACPADQKAQGYIALIKEGRWEDAYRTIKLDNPFPGICGRVCNHVCETECNRGLVDEPINIHGLKRFVVDKILESPREPIEAIPHNYEEKVAIIGAGPAGLTAAQDLAREGYPVTVFEAMPHAGGMLRFGIPEYKLPNEIIEREVQDIVDLGVELKLNHKVEDIEALFDEGFKAILVAIGAHDGIKLPIPGADLEDVIINTDFLRDMRLGKYHNGEAKPLGDKVLVLGGGNVAIDCARLARRLGKEVEMACLEGRDNMPAHSYEVDIACAEGITVHNSLTFERILSDENGKVAGVEASSVASFHFDETGRLHLEIVPHSKQVLECDTVIFAVGQRVAMGFLEKAGIQPSKRRAVEVDPETFATSREGVFSAGDSVRGTYWAINAIADGHKAAKSMIRYLQGKPLEPITKPDKPVVAFSQEEIDERITSGEIVRQPRAPMPSISMAESMGSLKEINLGYDEETAKAEAARCLSCSVCSECMSCVFACKKGAINHDDIERTAEINVGAIILAPGYQIYNAQLSEEFGLGRYPNVVTSLQYERMLSASGPTSGHIKRPSDGKSPKRIAFLQCIGSRDKSHDYCSSVCCMYAAKEAIMTIEHAQTEARSGNGSGEVKCQVFFMDTRSYSKGYEEYYQRAEKKYGVKYTRCRLSDIKEDPITKNLKVRYTTSYEETHSMIEEEFDLVALSVGMEISESVKTLGHTLGIELDQYGFCHTTLFDPLQTSRAGIYVAGPFREPKDIPETVIEASGAAAATAGLLSSARHSLTKVQEYPPEKDVTNVEERVGVFVCHCGSNIGGYLDVPNVTEYARTLPGVVHAEDNLYTCSQDSISHIIDQVKALDLNRVVVASCTPITHEPLFQDAIRQAGLNPHLFEMANIRNQCSWVHPSDWDGATEKAKSLVRMSVAKARKLNPIKTSEVPVNNTALIIGGGPAGMTAALTLADQDFPVHIIEKEDKLGGAIQKLGYFHASNTSNGNGTSLSPKEYLSKIISDVEQNDLIEIHLNSELIETGGFKGNFTSRVNQEGKEIKIQHGAIIVATGGIEYKGQEYGYGKDPRILTQMDFESLLVDNEERGGTLPDSVVMIQCIGPAEKYCSRICCTNALKNALKLKEINPNADVTILYRDIRTYGFKERYYTQARAAGVKFVHYEFDKKPEVIYNEEGTTAPLKVRFLEPILGREFELNPDLLVLSTPIVPAKGSKELASKLKLSIDMDGFFLEAHVKLRPVDFSADGIFMAGTAHYPKFLDETIAQAQAAASRAAIILSKKTMLTNARVAVVDPSKCVGCLTCVRICPYNVPKITSDHTGVGKIVGTAYIEPAVCHGCGSCSSECPAKAIDLMYYVDAQLIGKIDALFEQEPI
jgi:heterodisulfide reductase subunit A-like polyferredoxin